MDFNWSNLLNLIKSYLVLKLEYFSYFTPIHIHTLIASFIVSFVLLIIPLFLGKNLNKYKKITIRRKYATYLGIFILIFKIVDSLFRYFLHKEPFANVLLVHLCNFAAVFAGLYLIFKSKTLFNITYFLSFGAAFALILPGVTFYYHPIYVYIFMIMHALEFVAVIYGFAYLKDTITSKGFKISIFTLLLLFGYSAIYNYIFRDFGINAMFLNDYIAPMVSFIEPFWLYRVVLITTMMFIMWLMYIPFRKKKYFF